MDNAIEATTPDLEIDPYTGQLKEVKLHQNTIVQTSINRNLLYTKAEVDAKIVSPNTVIPYIIALG